MYTNGLALDDYETLEDMLEDLEYDEMYDSDESDDGDFAERRRRTGRGRRRAPAPRTATGNQLFRPRPNSQYVTQTQLQSALARVGGQIKTNADAIKTINTRLNTVSSEQTRQAALLRRESSERKKQDDLIKQDMRQKIELLTLLPLLSRPSSETIQVGERSVEVLTKSNNTLSMLLPLLLMGGMGGSSAGGSSGLGDNNSMMLMALVLMGDK
ncbi:MAG: hypothetical protein KME20_22750 [Kaiparowitsia implicata GSE-PSE-MK54-09C]|jgi:hypothetical protein|nr:hypothetical protein [Kaiparowitsia implicata GSE-PSE-MK54-09C]